MIGPQKYQVILKFSYLENISDRFAEKISEEVNQFFGFVRLRTILYTDWSVSDIYKDISPNQEKSNIIKLLVITVVVTTWETIS